MISVVEDRGHGMLLRVTLFTKLHAPPFFPLALSILSLPSIFFFFSFFGPLLGLG